MSSAAHRLLAAREKVTRILCKKIILSKMVVLVHIDGSKVFEIYIYMLLRALHKQFEVLCLDHLH